MSISVHFNPYFSKKWYNIILYSLIVSGVLLFLYMLGEVIYIPVPDNNGYNRPTGLTKRALVLFGLSMLLFVAALVFHFVYTYYSEHKKLLKKISTEPIPGIPTYSVQNFSIPTSFALTMPPVIDQGALGSCTSNAASNCVRFNEQGVVFQPSRLFIYYNARVKLIMLLLLWIQVKVLRVCLKACKRISSVMKQPGLTIYPSFPLRHHKQYTIVRKVNSTLLLTQVYVKTHKH